MTRARGEVRQEERRSRDAVFFRDGGKVIEEHRGDVRIKYLYDAEGITGFKVFQSYFYFVKDASGSVRSVLRRLHH